MKQILIIQTAFIGDAILATAMVESIRTQLPESSIDFVLRKGNEGLLANNPHIRTIYIWDKKSGKYSNLRKLAKELRQTEYDALFNLQRFASAGFLAMRCRAKFKACFSQSPMAKFHSATIPHDMESGKHEVERNLELLNLWPEMNFEYRKPKLYPSQEDRAKVESFQSEPYCVLAPASVWYTKQLPKEKWIVLCKSLLKDKKLYLIGGPSDREYLDEIIQSSGRVNIQNLAGELTLLQSAALIEKAQRTYVNDSAPLHLASAVNAPVTAFFCSTIPQFGFGPLSDDNQIVEVSVQLSCRPCGLHGHKSCPEGHFRCANEINLLG